MSLEDNHAAVLFSKSKVDKLLDIIDRQLTHPLRVCRVCAIKALSEDDLALFAKNKTSAYGHQNICLKCLHEGAKERRYRPVEDPPGSARCPPTWWRATASPPAGTT